MNRLGTLIALMLALAVTGLVASDVLADKGTTVSAKKRSTSPPISPQANRGRALLNAHQCLACHRLAGEGAKDGVSLDNLGRTRQFIVQHIMDPEGNVAKNPDAFRGDPNLMPSNQLSLDEARSIADYLIHRKTQTKSKVGKTAGRTGKDKQ